MVIFFAFFRDFDFSTGGEGLNDRFIEFLRLFDQGEGSKLSILLNFFDFLTFRPGEESKL